MGSGVGAASPLGSEATIAATRGAFALRFGVGVVNVGSKFFGGTRKTKTMIHRSAVLEAPYGY